MTISFSINFDYRCPFARNANEHVVTALVSGGNYEVAFNAFSLTEVHIEEGQPSVFDDQERRPELLAIAAGIVVRDRFPERFYDAHLSLFAIRHDDGDDLRDETKIRGALRRAGVDDNKVFDELTTPWPFETLRTEHETSVKENAVFGVPTFIYSENAAFVRLMSRPEGDGELARRTIDEVLDLLAHHSEINEFKHTTIPR